MAGRQHAPLLENEDLAFAGAHVQPGLVMGHEEAERILATRNRHGKPNADVVRPYRDADDLRGLDSARWIVDFPADMTPEEASLYEQPWRLWVKAGGVLHARVDPMRIAVSRIEWFLVAPSRIAPRGFARLETPALPGAGLAVVASDDDFVSAVLESGVFNAWVDAHGGRLRVKHVASFPFPWPPRTELGALTREQLELRDRVIRAGGDDLDDAVAAAYGWHDIAGEADVVSHLRATHYSRPVRR